MEYTNTIIRDGKTIELTDDEIENIYRFQEQRYRLSDAKVHVNTYILRYTKRDDDPWIMDIKTITEKDRTKGLSRKDIAKFHRLLAMTNDDLEYMASEFQSRFDCNCDENTLWNIIIDDFLNEELSSEKS